VHNFGGALVDVEESCRFGGRDLVKEDSSREQPPTFLAASIARAALSESGWRPPITARFDCSALADTDARRLLRD
jgi:hypothetical protein